MNRLTAYMIATNDVEVLVGGSKKVGGFVGWICMPPDGNGYQRELLGTEQQPTKKAAKKLAQEILEQVRSFVEEETKGKHPIDHVMDEIGVSQDESNVIKDIVETSKK